MNRFYDPRRLALSGALVVALASAAAPALVAAQAAPPEDFSCGDDILAPVQPSLAWVELPLPSSSATASGLTLRFDNPRSESVNVDVHLLADDGEGHRKTRRLRLRNVAPGRSETIPVQIADLGVDTQDMPFSGQIIASARVESESLCAGAACAPLRDRPVLDPDSDAPGSAMREARPSGPLGDGPIDIASPPAFFHPSDTQGTFELYGREVLVGRWAGGDIDGGSSSVSDVNLVRTSGGGKFAKHKNKFLPEMSVGTFDDDNASGTPFTPLGPIKFTANLIGFCVRWEIDLGDHGKKITTAGGVEITEDYWNGQPKGDLKGLKAAGASGSGRMSVTARGVTVIAQKGSYAEILQTHPQTGCIAFAGDGDGVYELTVLTHHRDNRGNTMNYHGAAFFPYAFQETVELKTGKTAHVSVGDFTPEATVAAISAFAMYRTTFGVTGKTMFVKNENTCGDDDDGNPNSNGANNSSAHFDFSGLADGKAYVRIHDGSRPGCSGSDHRRWKFLVGHEIGHAWQLLNQKVSEPDASHGLVDNDESVCTPTESGYSITTLEFSAIGAREGMAHLYAAVVWNSPASAEGVFTWFGSPENMESSDSAEHGGRLFNVCDTSNKCGKGTVLDWLRHWWDWHTPWLPGVKPDPADSTKAYGNAMNDDGTDRENYYQKLDEFTDALPALVPHKPAWDHFASLNGVATSPDGPGCKVLSYPGCDLPDPYDGEGSPGCPCADVEDTLSESELGDDRHYPDGTASYLVHGQGGRGQYCIDLSTSDNVEAVCNKRASDSAPECMQCEIDTMLACACESDAQCQSLGDTTLECWGGDDQGWPGTASGRCMPSATNPQGRSVLDENPWICLESCTSRGGGDPDRFVCLYDQREPNVSMGHAQCVDIVGCTAPEGYCEQSGALCDTEEICNIDFDDCCVAECTMTADCPTLGFPNTYVCDNEGPGFPGFCVPAGCDAPMADQEFCGMFR